MKLSDCRIGNIVYNKTANEFCHITGLADGRGEVILRITNTSNYEYECHPNNLLSIEEYEDSEYDRD